MPYVRTVRTSSGATAVQIVWTYRRGSREIEHLGSAHSEVDIELLKAGAVQRIAAGQDELPLGRPAKTEPVALEITNPQMGRLLDAVGYRRLRPAVAHRTRLPDVQSRPAGRPVYYHKRESIDAHLAVVFAALAISHHIEIQTGLDDQEIRPRTTPLPDHQDQHRRPHRDRRRPIARRGPPSTGRHPPGCALVWPKSGVLLTSAARQAAWAP